MLRPFQTNVLCPSYTHELTGRKENRLDFFPDSERIFDREKVADFMQRTTSEKSTCFEHISRRMAGLPVIDDTLEESLAKYDGAVVALSGGLDSFTIAGMIKRITGTWPVVATLVTKLDEYCEAEETQRMAKQLGIPELILVESNEEEFIESLTEVIQAAEVPLYNLHPVSKWIFAKKIAALGFSSCITGDGVDQLFAHVDGHDYLPIVGALFAVSGVQLECPFYREDLRPKMADPNKSDFRHLARGILPDQFVQQKKRRGFTPMMDLSRYGTFAESIPDKEKILRLTLSLLEQSHC